MVSQHLTYLIVHGASASEHIIDLTCNVTSQEQLIEEFFVIWHHPDKFGDHGHCKSEDMFLIGHVTACIKGQKLHYG